MINIFLSIYLMIGLGITISLLTEGKKSKSSIIMFIPQLIAGMLFSLFIIILFPVVVSVRVWNKYLS